MKVQLSYGAFTQTMSIYIDDQPLSHVSRLTKYQSQPFETWCEEITPHRPNTIFHQRLLPNTASIYCGYVHFIPFLKLNSMCPSCWMITLSTSATNDPGSKPAHSFILSISFLRRRRWGLPAFQSDSGYPGLSGTHVLRACSVRDYNECSRGMDRGLLSCIHSGRL